MTRGQESLVMELDEPLAEIATFTLGSRPTLRVVRAGADELAEHDRVLKEIDQASKGKCLWSGASVD
jgi:DNA polymerase-3 subunit epsilon